MPTIHGTFFDDTRYADEGNQVENDPVFFMYGYEGNDDLFGASNDDLIDGGTGADLMMGGLGDDTYVVDNTGDRVLRADDFGKAMTPSTRRSASRCRIRASIVSLVSSRICRF